MSEAGMSIQELLHTNHMQLAEWCEARGDGIGAAMYRASAKAALDYRRPSPTEEEMKG